MNGSSPHIYSAADIERYHSGQMTARERHALEKAALDDPFLADALEGYTFTSTPQQDLEALKERLAGKKEKRRSGLWTPSSMLWRAAAIIIVVAGLSWLILSGTLFNDRDIAVRTTPDESGKGVSVQASPTTESSDSITTPQADQELVKKDPPASQLRSKASKTAAPPAMEAEANDEVAGAPVIVQQGYEKEFKKDAALNRRMNQTAAAGSPFTNNSNIGIPAYRNTTDSNQLVINNDVKTVNGSDTIRNLNVVLKPTNDKLEEVVVAKSAPRKQKMVTENRTIEESEPAEGWSTFNDYIADNLKQPEDVKGKALSGEVELSFDISKEGYATNIRVERSLCNTCDVEAIRLVREGPKWKSKKSRKGKIVIHF